MKKREGYVDARPWLVVQDSDGRAEVLFDRGQPGLEILPGGRYWREEDAMTHRDTYNRDRDEAEEGRRRGQGDLFAEARP